jgi:hypothetical protein
MNDPKKSAAPAKTAAATPAAPPKPERVTRYRGPDGIAVAISKAAAGGVVAFGDLKPGVEYVVAPDEADRLTAEARGAGRRFATVGADDAQRLADFRAAKAAAAKAAEAQAATLAANDSTDTPAAPVAPQE